MASSTNINVTLEQLNDRKAILLIPAAVYVGILMIVGSIGNTLVFIYFGCQARRSSTTVFISILAIFDLIACVISMPGEILDVRYYIAYENVFFCKLSKFINHLSAVGSSLALIVVAVDRHRRICTPLRRQVEVKQAGIACLIVTGSALFFAWPSLIFYQPTKVEIPVSLESNLTITGQDCTTTKDKKYTLFIMLFNGLYLLIFLILFISVVVMYSRIGHIVIQHSKSNTGKSRTRKCISMATSQSSTANTAVTDVSKTTDELQETETEFGKETNEADLGNGTNTTRITIGEPVENNSRWKNSPAKRKYSLVPEKPALDPKAIKSTMIMITITAAFIISCLPYLGLVLWSTFKGVHESDFLSDDELVFFEIGMRSYFLQNSINPILYGVLNEKFRSYVRQRVCFCSKGRNI